MRTKLYLLVALLASALSTSAHAQTGLADTRPIKPVLMLLVDTSGSMEHMPNSTGCVDCDPICTPSNSQKNRWAITLEALTGSFDTFACTTKARSSYVGQYDATYFLPHYDFTTGATPTTFRSQASDGVLDAYQNRIKFGLMTFDGVATTSDGATLVPFANYASTATFRTQVLGVEGQYSYPDVVSAQVPVADATTVQSPVNGWGWKPLSFPGCSSVYGVNAGARGKGSLPGSLVSVGNTEVTSDITTINASIQNSLLAVRPFGGTPIAAMLDDLRYYLNNDNDIKKGTGGDPYYTCRKRYAILLTDGAPDTLYRNDPRFQCESSADGTCAGGVCQCPYDTEENIALKLRKNDGLEKLWVVAFNVSDATALASLDRIAQAGSETDALRALTPAALRSELDRLMSIAQPEATSRSVPVVMNTGRAVMLGGKQFEITAGFRVGSTDDEPWQGYLYRRRIECSGASAVAQDLAFDKGDMFHLTLDARAGSTRNIQATLPTLATTSGSLFVNAAASTAITASKTNAVRPNGSTFAAFTLPALTATETLQSTSDYNNPLKTFGSNAATLPAYFSGGTSTNRDNINNYLRGITSNRTNRTLGDIYHSNPVVLPPLYAGSDDLAAFDPQLRTYFKSLLTSTGTAPAGHYGTSGRPGVVFVGSNDGLLHAFNLDTWKDKAGTTYGPGYEFWSFVPSALFNKLTATATPTHQFMFDGTPVIKEMMVNNGTVKTILLAAVRGAPAYIALDITWPEAPTFLWQRSFPYLGDTTATPALAQVKVNWNSTATVRGVAILPGGSGTLTGTPATACDVDQLSRGKATGGRDKVRCWNNKGRTLHVVDVLTGELIQEFDQRHFHSPMTGSASVDGDGLTLSHAAYMTDEDGILWRLSMFNTDPSKWRVAPIWDLYAGTSTDFSGTAKTLATPDFAAGRTATYAPLLTRNPTTGNVTIVLGTGDVDSLTDAVPNRVASLEEARTLDSYGELTTSSITANWKLQLDAGEGVTGPLVMLDDTVYFTSFRGPAGGTGDICEIGVSRIVGADVRQTVSGTNLLPKPKLTPETGTALVLQYQPTSASSSLLLGLSIARDPVCTVGTADNNPIAGAAGTRVTQTGATGGGAFQVRSMVAGTGGTVIPGSTSSGTGQRQFTRTLPVNNIARSVGWASSIE
ncbi:MAG: hypothetical protein RLZZ450_4985 [Pseudomonadota bacterium]|jgi:type IV pilus assembly protein PilY1